MSVNWGLEDKVVLVTGGGGGIGGAIATEVGRQGGKVAIVDASLAEASRAAEQTGLGEDRARPYEADVRDLVALEKVVADVEASLGPIWGVAACAGITRPAASVNMSAADWSAVIDVNLTGSFLTAQACARPMLERGEGSIVLIGSTNALGGQAERPNYAASKHAVIGLARSLAIEWGRSGIRVNVVAPGPVDTPMYRAVNSEEMVRITTLPRVPLGKLAEPEDEANACLFLMSSASSHITGAVLPVDGGLTAGFFTNIPSQ
jgi:NAD(P)-dependent dehydrogenase (short-subunit alcohol dehydrogenase family)